MKEEALYIHIPFCVQKCMYCDFPSFCGKDSLMVEYARVLSLDIKKSTENKLISTVFIGGGTPTYLSLEAWGILKESINSISLKENAEFTIECNPGTINTEKLQLFKEMRVNRLSIGLQAWQNSLLKSIGRIHTVEEFISGYVLARKMGINNINIDLIFGLPGQSLEDWLETIRNVIKLSPEHISCYGLIIEEGTAFYSLNENSKLNLPSEEIEREMYHSAVSILKENGYYQYEISNFSKEGNECKHNLVYWNLENYAGCGAAAHSYIDGIRYKNAEEIEKYIEYMVNYVSGIIETHTNSIEEEIEEYMFMGLRKINGINEKKFEKKFNRSIDSIYKNIVNKYIAAGLVNRASGHIYLTEKGIEFSNIVMSELLLSK